ncbi:MAG: YfcE family phosphodiesterase [Clostridiales bacterium]|nr:YfcE family phosphodiesterase [Clostridiales bacterium]
MLRALVLSDIHGDDTTFRWLLERVWQETGPIDAYLCLGDGVRDFERAERFIRERDEHAVMYAVKGNNDWCDAPLTRIITLGGVRIFMTHGHNQRVKSTMYYLQDAVRDAKCDVGLYGHTHCADIEMNVPLLVNPGAVCSDRCALLEIRDGKPHARLLNYGFR